MNIDLNKYPLVGDRVDIKMFLPLLLNALDIAILNVEKNQDFILGLLELALNTDWNDEKTDAPPSRHKIEEYKKRLKESKMEK